MLRIRKIYIENFKGVHRPSVIDFDEKQLTILSGPNGFGKTTIFDVIELCLRGRLNRTMTYNNVTKKNSGHKKPFYQNTSGEDVLLKLWLHSSEGDHVIIKRLDKNTPGSRTSAKAFRPDAWDLIDTYYSNDVSLFDQQPDYSTLNIIDQAYIDRLFFGDSGLSIENLYPLFNYLQQEDNIYFLKKDEDTKKNELAFLFQTQRESEDLDKITETYDVVSSVKQVLQARIELLGSAVQNMEQVPYANLFPNTSYQFDLENPFAAVPVSQLEVVHNNLQNNLQQLLDFVENFSPEEYNRKKFRNQLLNVVNNRLLMATLVARELLGEARFNNLTHTIATNRRFSAYLEGLAQFNFNEEILLELGFAPEFIRGFFDSISQRSKLLSEIGEIGRIVRELNTAREQTFNKFHELHVLNPQESNCPLCNAHWDNIEALDISFNKTQRLTDYNRNQQNQLTILEQEVVVNYISSITQRIQNYLSAPDNLIDNRFYLELSERRGNLDNINRFALILENQGIDVSSLIITEPVTLERFNENITELQRSLTATLESLNVDESRLVGSELFAQYFGEDQSKILVAQKIIDKQIYIRNTYTNTRNFSLNVLIERLSKVTALEERIKTVKDNFSACIKAYKKTMIEKIKIPFYIYSGKILQHYQQGYGIFVDVKDSTSRVRFLTGENTDHDIIHQLSSGQLAVVSIAFCLALNKVYQAPQHFKFLAIDDPVQTLDDLNIHSFIELLRHEFSDYKMVISTHEEHIANYLLYKFDKFQFTNRKLNVQHNFYVSEFDSDDT